MPAIHRTAVFTLYHLTPTERAILDRAFRDYTAAYTELLHACETHYDVDALRGMATYQLSNGTPRTSARTLSKRLYTDEAVARTLAGVCMPLESRLRQSVKEHVAQTLMSYVALYDAQTEDATRGGAPTFPSRLRPNDIERVRSAALREFATLADNRAREREVVARLQQTRRSMVVGIPFVGVDHHYGCGLYYSEVTRRFYARLDIVASSSRKGRPITRPGIYTDIKTGARYQAQPQRGSSTPEGTAGVESFGRGTKSLLVELEMQRYHESRLRFSAAAFLPQRGTDPSQPTAAVPVSAKLVRRGDGALFGNRASDGKDKRRDRGDVRYELHVSFELPAPEVADGLDETTRPLLALNRGIHLLVAGVLTSPDARRVLDTFEVSGTELRVMQETYERVRRARQQRGAHIGAKDRRQSRLAEHHVALCANQIVEHAVRSRAQVVMEDLTNFATGHALRATTAQPPTRRAALRAILNRRQFQAIIDAVDQRLEVAGLPSVRLVGAGHISQTCWECGHTAPDNRQQTDRRVFRCVHCGASGDVDTVAAGNIARKLVWLRRRGREKRAGLMEDARTSWAVFTREMPLIAGPAPQHNPSG